MHELLQYAGKIFEGFQLTVLLVILAGGTSIVVGAMLALMLTSPIRAWRAAAWAYVGAFRNVPAVLVFILVVFGLPTLDFRLSYFMMAVLAMVLYESAFVCEAFRSGINSVERGQAHAAMSIGLTYNQYLRLILFRQAMAASVQPIANVLIKLTKGTAIAAAFGVTEATFQLESLVRDRPDILMPVFLGITGGYVVIGLTIGWLAIVVERRMAVIR